MTKSKVYSINDDDFRELINKSNTYSQVLRALGLTPRGGSSLKVLKQRINDLNLNTSHFLQKHENGAASNRIELSKILVANSTYASISRLKIRLVKEGLLEYKCSICQNTGEWNNKKLILQLDHINGINNDHRLENLRFLCPNCHSQTSTYVGKNKGV